MYRPAYNLTDRPILIDAAGRQLPGREWGAVDTTSDEVRAGVDAHELVLHDPDAIGADAAEGAVAAKDRAAVLEERRAAYSAADVDALRKAAVAGELTDPDDLSKAELVRALTLLERDPGDLLPKTRRSSSAPTPEP